MALSCTKIRYNSNMQRVFFNSYSIGTYSVDKIVTCDTNRKFKLNIWDIWQILMDVFSLIQNLSFLYYRQDVLQDLIVSNIVCILVCVL